METFKYLLEVSLGTAVFLIVYWAFFRNTTLHHFNRIFLVMGIVISFLYPHISFTSPVSWKSPVQIAQTKFSATAYEPMITELERGASSFNYALPVAILYCIVAAVMLARFVRGIVGIYKLKLQSNRTRIDGRLIYINPNIETFSFINMIFAPSTNVNPLIVRHEEAHLKQKHWIDNFLLELASIVLWFNPIIYCYKAALRLQHECLADRYVISQNATGLTQYLDCLLSTSLGMQVASSSFGTKPIKTRIIMITKKKTSALYALLYMLAIPCITLVLFAFQPAEKFASAEPLAVSEVQDTPSELPVEASAITDVVDFGMRFHPVLKKMMHHNGTDFTAPAGAKVMATANGVVLDAGFDKVKGNFITIRHSDQYVTQYFHMQELQVKAEAEVKKGETIGLVGNTGLSKAVHLHYEVLKDGKAVDPKNYYRLERLK